MTEVLKKLATYDLAEQAKKLGIASANNIIITKQDTLDLIKIVNNLAIEVDDIKSPNFKKIIYIIGLMTDYKLDKSYNLDVNLFLSLTLTTLGMPIAAKMINDDFINSEGSYLNINGPSFYLNNLLNKNRIIYKDTNYYLTDYQMEIYKQIDRNRIIGINGDTSTGKSFAILLKLAQYLKQSRKIKILYVVPTLSLENQVQRDFINMCGSQYVSTEYDEERKKQILIQTYDKATYTVDEINFDVIVVDEIQNMSEFLETDEHRKWKLYDLLKKVDIKNKYTKVILAGPYINNLTDFIKNTFKNSRKYRIKTVDGKQIPVSNIQYYFKQNDEEILFCTNPPFAELETVSITCPKEYDFPVEIFKYRESNNGNVCRFLADVYQKIYAVDVHSTIMYIGARGRGEEILNTIETNFNNVQLNIYQQEFVNFLKDTVHEKYFLINNFKNKGIVVHNGVLPRHIRNILELVFKEEQIKGLITTSTLLQGVNMPIKNIIIKDLTYDGRSGRVQKLDSYEHANLCGRAGRLMIDLVGRIFILGEVDICNYRSDDTINKELEANKTVSDDTLQQIIEEDITISNFQDNLNDLNIRKRILSILSTSSSFSNGMEIIQKYFIVDNNEANINNLKNLYKRVKSLEIKKKATNKFISQNIDWDLFELNQLYVKFKKGDYDELIKDFGMHSPNNLGDASKILRKLTADFLLNFPISSNRVLKKVFKKKDIDENYTQLFNFKSELETIYTAGIKYAREYSHKNMIKNFTSENKINNFGNVLNIFRYYLVPLIKPIFQLYEKDNFIEASEIGGFSKGYKFLLEKTIERETAIRILDKFDKKIRFENIEEIKNNYISKLMELNYWEKEYYKYLINENISQINHTKR